MAESPKNRILVVDDEEAVRDSLRAVIEAMGVEVVTAHDGATAIVALRKGRLCLVVLDLGLPGISGMRVLEWMSSHAHDLPVLVVTGLENAPNLLLRFPNLVKIQQQKPVPNHLLEHLVETYAL